MKLTGTPIAAMIVPTDDSSVWATHSSKYGKGGWRECATLEQANKMIDAYYEIGMCVYITSEQKAFVYKGEKDGQRQWQELTPTNVVRLEDERRQAKVWRGTLNEYNNLPNTIQGYKYDINTTYIITDVVETPLATGILQFKVVDELPTANIDIRALYLIKIEGTDSRYQMYIFNVATSQYMTIGDTAINLEGYATETYVINNFVAIDGQKQLSTNDYTDYDKAKLATIEEGAQANVQADWSIDDPTDPRFIKNKPTVSDNPTTPILPSDIRLSDCINDVPFAEQDSVDNMGLTIADIQAQVTHILRNMASLMTPSGDPLHYTYVTRGATYNPDTDRWTIDIVNDLTTAEVREIHWLQPMYITAAHNGCFANKTIRAVFPLNIYGAGIYLKDPNVFFLSSWAIVTIPTRATFTLNGDCEHTFLNCYSLKKIEKIAFMDYYLQSYNTNRTFEGCNNLEEIRFPIPSDYSFLQYNLNLRWSANLSVESVVSMINATLNNSSQREIVITLHPTAYERAMASEEVQAALLTHPRISFASA